MSHAANPSLIEAPVLDMDPYSEENLENPRPFQTALRDTGPVVWIEKYGMYAVGRHEELRQVMSDYRRFTTTGGIGMSDIRKPGAWRSPSPITEIDPPEHTAVRGSMMKILSPLIIRQWREVFERKAEALAEIVVERGEVDGVKDIAEAFVLDVFLGVLGVDFSKEEFLVIGDMNFNQQGPKNELFRRSGKPPRGSWTAIRRRSSARTSCRPKTPASSPRAPGRCRCAPSCGRASTPRSRGSATR